MHPRSDRIAEAITKLRWSDDLIVVNIQGDEPFLEPGDVRAVADLAMQFPDTAITTLSVPLAEEYHADPNVVKVLVDRDGIALSFSRSMPPQVGGVCRRHLGIYAYRCGYLRRFTHLPASAAEKQERLEQLRALDQGDLIRVGEAVSKIILGIDTEAELRAAGAMLERLD